MASNAVIGLANCATPARALHVREKRNAPPATQPVFTILSAAETQPLKINGMKPVGNYAYSIAFSDGHDTGIFTFDLLRTLGEVKE